MSDHCSDWTLHLPLCGCCAVVEQRSRSQFDWSGTGRSASAKMKGEASVTLSLSGTLPNCWYVVGVGTAPGLSASVSRAAVMNHCAA